VPAAMKPAGEMQFQPAKDTKKIRLDEADSSKLLAVGAGLDSK